jgi:hypothetical protein
MLHPLKDFCLFNPCFVLALAAMALIGSCRQVTSPNLPFDSNRVVDVVGWISRAPQILDDHIYLELSPLRVEQQSRSLPYPGHLAVFITSSVREPEDYFNPPLVYGEILALSSFLQEPRYYAIPGVADFRKIARLQGINHRIRLKSPHQARRLGHHPAARLLQPLFGYVEAFRMFCRRTFQLAQLKLIFSVFLGDQRTLEESDKQLIGKLGVYHLFVVSGFHVSMVVFFLHWVSHLWGLPGRLLTLMGLWTYVVMVGMSLPTLRAGIMTSLFYLLLTFGLSRQFLNALGISVLLVLTFFLRHSLLPASSFRIFRWPSSDFSCFLWTLASEAWFGASRTCTATEFYSVSIRPGGFSDEPAFCWRKNFIGYRKDGPVGFCPAWGPCWDFFWD